MNYKNLDLSSYGNNIKVITPAQFEELKDNGSIHFNDYSIYKITTRTRQDRIAVICKDENAYLIKLNVKEKGE